MSNYINIGEDQSFEWNIVPLSMSLYGVEDPTDRPAFGSFKVKHLLELCLAALGQLELRNSPFTISLWKNSMRADSTISYQEHKCRT